MPVLPWLAAVLVLSACVAGPAPAPSAHPRSTTRSAVPSTEPPATVDPDPDHVATLTRALRTMSGNQSYVAQTPGAMDVMDYGIGDLWTKGIDGTGTTVALVEGWDDPYIDQATSKYDHALGLPDPDIETIYPSGDGKLPPRCPAGMAALGTYGSCDAWAVELTLDVEAVHVIAPYAKIVLAVTPADSEIPDDAASQVAPPEMMRAVADISAHRLADVVSISDGTGESTFSDGAAQIHAQDPGELAAAAAGIPLVVGTGDCGPVQNEAVANDQCGAVTAKPDTAAWDDSPWVTAVGGTVPDFSGPGTRSGPDTVWQEGKLAEGAGFSAVYPRPDYQNGVASITRGTMRSVPDIAMDAQLGTSEATPLFAGVLALATQLNHGPVGPINPALYGVVGPHGAADGITDVVSGNNGVPGVPGFSAAPGFDVATGWGTVDASRFVPALVTAVRGEHGAPRTRAAADLTRLENGARMTGNTVTGGGFLPRHPVRVAVDGKPAGTVTATPAGTVTDVLQALRPGGHTLTLTGMLQTQTVRFTSH